MAILAIFQLCKVRYFKRKVWTKFLRVGYQVHTYKCMQNPKYGDGRDLFPWFGRDFFIFQVIPKEILHLMVSLIISNLIINQQNPKRCRCSRTKANFYQNEKSVQKFALYYQLSFIHSCPNCNKGELHCHKLCRNCYLMRIIRALIHYDTAS